MKFELKIGIVLFAFISAGLISCSKNSDCGFGNETEYIVFGKPNIFNGRFNIAHPEIELASIADAKQRSAFQAVYSSTEKLN